MLAIIDYGAGNLHSVLNALKYLGVDAILADSPDKLLSADAAILPGVGSFEDAVNALKSRKLDSAVKQYVADGKPLLGICLGLQLLFEYSEESPGVKGLSLFKGGCKRIPNVGGQKVPHVGWNSLTEMTDDKIFDGLPNDPYFYFVHTYALHSTDRSIVIARASYGIDFDVMIKSGNLYATQFHPEKSGDIGIKLLDNFLKLSGVK